MQPSGQVEGLVQIAGLGRQQSAQQGELDARHRVRSEQGLGVLHVAAHLVETPPLPRQPRPVQGQAQAHLAQGGLGQLVQQHPGGCEGRLGAVQVAHALGEEAQQVPGVQVGRVQADGGAQTSQAGADHGHVADTGSPAGQEVFAGLLNVAVDAPPERLDEAQLLVGQLAAPILLIRRQGTEVHQGQRRQHMGVGRGLGVLRRLVQVELGAILEEEPAAIGTIEALVPIEPLLRRPQLDPALRRLPGPDGGRPQQRTQQTR